jgi:hypothetical protein
MVREQKFILITGHFRDSWSLGNQCIQEKEGSKVSNRWQSTAVGTTDRNCICNIIKRVCVPMTYISSVTIDKKKKNWWERLVGHYSYFEYSEYFFMVNTYQQEETTRSTSIVVVSTLPVHERNSDQTVHRQLEKNYWVTTWREAGLHLPQFLHRLL